MITIMRSWVTTVGVVSDKNDNDNDNNGDDGDDA